MIIGLCMIMPNPIGKVFGAWFEQLEKRAHSASFRMSDMMSHEW